MACLDLLFIFGSYCFYFEDYLYSQKYKLTVCCLACYIPLKHKVRFMTLLEIKTNVTLLVIFQCFKQKNYCNKLLHETLADGVGDLFK